MPNPIFSQRPQRKLFRIAAGVLVLMLLLPVPGLALTFLGVWQVFVSMSGAPGEPAPVVLPPPQTQDNLRGGVLSISMGEFIQNGFAGSVSITAIRDFRVNGASELVTIRRSFASLLGDGNIRVTVNITPYNISNPPPFTIPVVNRNRNGLPIDLVSDNSSNTGLFIGGNYRVTINITYEKNTNGYWKNITPHRFEFFGI